MTMNAAGRSASPLRIAATGTYDLASVALLGFGNRDDERFDGVMRLAFCLDEGYDRQVGVEVRQDGNDVVIRVVHPLDARPLDDDAHSRLRAQIMRVLSLDHDGDAFQQVCESDPALAAALRQAPGFRPALFTSPYEAAVCSVIGARRSRRQALAQLTRLAEQFGTTVELAGQPTSALPTPEQLMEVQEVPGLADVRLRQLHAVADAARRGDLDAERLRGMSLPHAAAELQRLPGIGPFYSSLILERACGHADLPPIIEEHTRAAVGQAYDLPAPDDMTIQRLSEGWRPFRTWVLVLLRSLADRNPKGG